MSISIAGQRETTNHDSVECLKYAFLSLSVSFNVIVHGLQQSFVCV